MIDEPGVTHIFLKQEILNCTKLDNNTYLACSLLSASARGVTGKIGSRVAPAAIRDTTQTSRSLDEVVENVNVPFEPTKQHIIVNKSM